MENEIKQNADKGTKEEPQELGPCQEAQGDGAPCNCAEADCRTCGKGVPVKK